MLLFLVWLYAIFMKRCVSIERIRTIDAAIHGTNKNQELRLELKRDGAKVNQNRTKTPVY